MTFANCWMIQRLASRSKATVASPSLADWQNPPKLDHSELVLVAAMMVEPVLE